METDEIDMLVNEAHAIFGATSVYEVIDSESKEEAIEFLNEVYGNPGSDIIDRYLDVTDRLMKAVI